jgi:GTPase SAR1 family protein
MAGITQNNLVKNTRDGIELLREISESSALSTEEKFRIVSLWNEFSDRINSIKHLRLGVIGEFNSGKSTLLNSILGKKIVATDDRPCTPIPIHIKGSEIEQLKIFYNDSLTREMPLSQETIDYYTTEGEGSRFVIRLEMMVDSLLLKENNITLIDTPGINSINSEHTEATLESLKDMDAAILLIYCNQPGSKSTIEFLQRAASKIHNIFPCISKSDLLPPGQLERIIRELPGRLTKNSGIKIDEVWPIQITDNKADEGLELFLQHIKDFMMGEWLEIISQDLRKTLNEYSFKIKSLLCNRMCLQEKILYEFTQLNPTDFSKVAERIKPAAVTRFYQDFAFRPFYQHMKTESNQCLENIRKQLSVDLTPNKRLFKIFKKRITKQKAKKAYENSISIFSRLLKQDYSLENKIVRYSSDIEKLAMSQLSKIHSTLQKFDEIVFEKLQDNPEIKRQARFIRFKRWLVFPGLTLLGFIILKTFYPFNHISILIAYAFITLSLITPLCFYFCPHKGDIFQLSIQQMQSIKKHPIPKFTVDSLYEEFQQKDTSWFVKLTESLGIKPLIPVFMFLNSVIARLIISDSYKKSQIDSFKDNDLRARTLINKISFFKRSNSIELYEKFLAIWESNIKLYEGKIIKQFNQLSENIIALSEKYITSLNENYSFVINEVFENNNELSRKFEDTIGLLKNFISQVNDLNIIPTTKPLEKIEYNTERKSRVISREIFIKDIKQGMSDSDLENKYQISHKNLNRLINKLKEENLLPHPWCQYR